MHDNGGVTTSERTKITSIGAESLALRVESYLEHFKKRVYSGLGMSAIDFGEGDKTGKATGEVLSGSLRDSVITYQLVIEDMVSGDIFNELLLESDKYKNNYIIPLKDQVFFKFHDVDPTTRIKKESHVLNKMSSGILTTNEARDELDYDPLSYNDLKKLYNIQIKMVNNEIDFDQNVRVSELANKNSETDTEVRKTKTGNSKTKNTKKTGAKKSSQSIVNPKNQHNQDSLLNNDNYNTIQNIKDIILQTNNIEILSKKIYDILNNYLNGEDADIYFNDEINNIVADILNISMMDSNKQDIFLLKIIKDIDKLHNLQYIEENDENKTKTA